MIRQKYHLTGMALLAMALTVCIAACGTGPTAGGGNSAVASSTASSPQTTPTVVQTTPTVVQTTPTMHTTVPLRRVTIPIVTGDSVLITHQIMMSNGLGSVTAMFEINLDYPYNDVIATDPPGGTVVWADSTVTLLVSEGVGGCSLCQEGVARIMPNVCGLTYQQANTLLAEKDITLSGQFAYQASSEPRGTIVGSIPAVGVTFIAYGSGAEAVMVTISSGQTTSPALTPTPGSPDGCSMESPPPPSSGSS